MASGFSHAIASIAIGRAINFRESFKFWFLGMVCAVLPDADVLAFRFGIPYASPFGHRGFTHSIVFAFLLSIVLVSVFYRQTLPRSKKWLLLFFFLFLSTCSHGILDACTNGGLGVAFFFPFDNTRYFFPWHPIQVSPIGVGAFFGEWGIRVMKSELLWIWIPSLAVIAISFLFRKKEPAA